MIALSRYRYGKRTSTVTSTRFVKEVIQSNEAVKSQVFLRAQPKLDQITTKLTSIRQSVSDIENTVAEVKSLF